MNNRNRSVVPPGYRYLRADELSPDNRSSLVGKKIAIWYDIHGWCHGKVIKYYAASCTSKGASEEQFEVMYGTELFYESTNGMKRSWLISTEDDDLLLAPCATPFPHPVTKVPATPAGFPQPVPRVPATSAASDPKPWGDSIHPNVMLGLLKTLSSDRLGKNSKALAATYSKEFGKLNEMQQNKVMTFWVNLDENTKNFLLKTATSSSTNYDDSAGAHVISDTTSKDDLVRLLHVIHDTRALIYLAYIRNANQPRPALDSRNSDVPSATGVTTMAEELNGYNGLTDVFNDPNNRYRNVAVRYNEKGDKIQPWQAADERWVSIAASCHSLNPSATDRPLRNASWVKEKVRDLRANLTRVFSNYTKSGKQDGADGAELDWHSEVRAVEWTKFSPLGHHYGLVVQYSFCLLEESDFDSLGKLLPVRIGRSGDEINSATSAEEDRKSRRMRKSRETIDLTGVIEATAKQELSVQALSQFGTEEDKKLGLQRLRNIAFESTTPHTNVKLTVGRTPTPLLSSAKRSAKRPAPPSDSDSDCSDSNN